MTSRPSAGASPQWPPIARRTIPARAKWLRPRVPRSPGPAANTRVRSRGLPVSRKRRSTAAASSSGTPTPTKPPTATVSPSRITRTAASALITLLRDMGPPVRNARPDRSACWSHLGSARDLRPPPAHRSYRAARSYAPRMTISSGDPCGPLWQWGAVEIAAATWAGEVSCVEVTAAVLERIAAVNPRLNAVTLDLADAALADAAALDAARARGEPTGPL